MVLWEAQFGDYPNVAQASLDLFIDAAGSKWGLRCGFRTGRMESLPDKALATVPHAAKACSAPVPW